MTDPGRSRDLVLVVGIGRSGTSAFTLMLKELGWHVPQPEVAADDTNPRGFGEPQWAVDFHAKLMRPMVLTAFDGRPEVWKALAQVSRRKQVVDRLSSWLEVQFVGADRVVVKDPRSAWFLPLWERCASDLQARNSLVTLLRPPTEILSSARRWYGDWQSDTARACGWLNVMLHTERGTREANRAFVSYDRMVGDWRGELARVARQLDLPALEPADEAAAARVDALVDPALRRETVTWDGLSGVPEQVRALVDEVWLELAALADDGGDDPGRRGRLDELGERYQRLYADSAEVTSSALHAATVKARRAKEEVEAAQEAARKARAKAAAADATPPVAAQPRGARSLAARALRRGHRLARAAVRRKR